MSRGVEISIWATFKVSYLGTDNGGEWVVIDEQDSENIDFNTSTAPIAGDCALTPLTGDALATQFQFACDDQWVSTNPASLVVSRN